MDGNSTDHGAARLPDKLRGRDSPSPALPQTLRALHEVICGDDKKGVSVANPWLRLYAEIRRDPKVRTMPETFQLRLIWLLTLRCEEMTEKMSSEELMYGLDCDEITLQKIHETFLQKGFIEKNWAVVNWDKRQYISDSSTQRVKKYRANKAMKQGETFPKQFHETHETQNETDQNRTEQNRTEQNRKNKTRRRRFRVARLDLEGIVDGLLGSSTEEEVPEYHPCFEWNHP